MGALGEVLKGEWIRADGGQREEGPVLVSLARVLVWALRTSPVAVNRVRGEKPQGGPRRGLPRGPLGCVRRACQGLRTREGD